MFQCKISHPAHNLNGNENRKRSSCCFYFHFSSIFHTFGSDHKLLLKYLMYSIVLFYCLQISIPFVNCYSIRSIVRSAIHKTHTFAQWISDRRLHAPLTSCQYFAHWTSTAYAYGYTSCCRNDIKFKPETEIEEKQSYRYVDTTFAEHWLYEFSSLQRSCVYSFTFTF